jgi:hypothetical protein
MKQTSPATLSAGPALGMHSIRYGADLHPRQHAAVADRSNRSSRLLRIPPIWCPIQSRCGPFFETIQHQTENWLGTMGFDDAVKPRVEAMNTGYLSSVWAPLATATGRQLLSDWLTWILLVDDHCDTGPVASDTSFLSHSLLALFQRGIHPEVDKTGDEQFDLYARGLTDICRRSRERVGPKSVEAIAVGHYLFAIGSLTAAADREQGRLRTINQHMLERPADGGASASISIVEAACGCGGPGPELRSLPIVRAITAAAELYFCLVTDLPSYDHESADGSLEANAIAIVANEQRCTVPEAVNYVCHLLEEIMALFLALRNRLCEYSAPTRHYASHLSDIVAGTIEWQRTVPRYSNVTSVLREGTAHSSTPPLHDVTSNRQFTPGGIEVPESIRWWWTTLDY